MDKEALLEKYVYELETALKEHVNKVAALSVQLLESRRRVRELELKQIHK